MVWKRQNKIDKNIGERQITLVSSGVGAPFLCGAYKITGNVWLRRLFLNEI